MKYKLLAKQLLLFFFYSLRKNKPIVIYIYLKFNSLALHTMRIQFNLKFQIYLYISFIKYFIFLLIQQYIIYRSWTKAPIYLVRFFMNSDREKSTERMFVRKCSRLTDQTNILTLSLYIIICIERKAMALFVTIRPREWNIHANNKWIKKCCAITTMT